MFDHNEECPKRLDQPCEKSQFNEHGKAKKSTNGLSNVYTIPTTRSPGAPTVQIKKPPSLLMHPTANRFVTRSQIVSDCFRLCACSASDYRIHTDCTCPFMPTDREQIVEQEFWRLPYVIAIPTKPLIRIHFQCIFVCNKIVYFKLLDGFHK